MIAERIEEGRKYVEPVEKENDEQLPRSSETEGEGGGKVSENRNNNIKKIKIKIK